MTFAAAWFATATAAVFLLAYLGESRAHARTRRALRRVAASCSCACGAVTVVSLRPEDVEADGWVHTHESCRPVAEGIP